MSKKKVTELSLKASGREVDLSGCYGFAEANSPKPKQEPPPLPGHLVKALVPGTMYIDRLSYARVLVCCDEHTGPHGGNPKDSTKKVVVYGWYFNAAYGTHQRMELKDHQLMDGPEKVIERG